MKYKTIEVQELLDLEDIEKNEKKYYAEYGYFPFNVSTWNPSNFFSNKFLMNRIHLSPYNYIPYIYSYELNKQKLLTTKTKLGGNNNYECLITNTGTSAISLVSSILKEIRVESVLVICPIYYSILYNLLQKDIKIYKLDIERTEKGYHLPQLQIIEFIGKIDAIWITNPIYNTGIYYFQEDIDFLQSIIPSNIKIVCDDCFSVNGHELIRSFRNHNNFISINDPLKQIMINGLKFACIMYPQQYDKLFTQWSDIICGSLTYSTVQSIDFFNSNEFDEINNQLHQHFNNSNKILQQLTNKFSRIIIDKQEHSSHMHMCIIKGFPYDYLQDIERMYLFMKETATSIIPGNRFHFPSFNNFSFRLNMGRECPEFWDALIRIFQYFS